MPSTTPYTLRHPRLLLITVGLLVLSTMLASADGRAAHAVTSDSEPATTPDCGPLPPDPFPALHRAKLMVRLGVDRWHKDARLGQGVKVAVLDSGFRGYRDHLGKALPARVTAKSFRVDENLEARDSQHGILCGEVVHALAPEAELLFANWETDSPSRWLEAAQWARREGARIISCSVIMPSWSDAEGGGPIHEALGRIVGDGNKADDVLLFASAGNTAQRHWAGTFRAGAGGWHEWRPDQIDNPLSPWGGDQVSVETCWRADADFEVVVRNLTTDAEVGRSSPRSAARTCAVVRFTPDVHHRYAVRLRQVRGEAAAFHMVALASGLGTATASGSVCFPGDGPEVIAVGACGTDGERSSYSSCGPNSTRPKPDLAAVVPFPSLWRSRPFTGTSAAAPQAAGLAALIWSAHPDWTARQVRDALAASARDVGHPGHDHETGHGLLHLPASAP